jgi:D-alanyl-D-alanine carboxypeptidase/D-alanyl-D-alanine-endopeptidase (penicillin-binding protein 4)
MSRRARVGRLVSASQAPQPPLATVSSPTVRKLIRITNQPSDNFYAEMLVKNLGARFGAGGTTDAGVTVVRDELAKLGVDPVLTDGSGLSRADRATPRQIVRLLSQMRDQSVGADWRASLAAPGQWGTLHSRMRGTAAAGRCRMKTGTLIGVSALSGYCNAVGGDVIAFSFLENNVCAVCAKRVEDGMVPAIARYSRR